MDNIYWKDSRNKVNMQRTTNTNNFDLKAPKYARPTKQSSIKMRDILKKKSIKINLE